MRRTNWAAKFSVTTIISATGIYSKLGPMRIHTYMHTIPKAPRATRHLTSQSPSPNLRIKKNLRHVQVRPPRQSNTGRNNKNLRLYIIYLNPYPLSLWQQEFQSAEIKLCSVITYVFKDQSQWMFLLFVVSHMKVPDVTLFIRLR